MNKLSAALVAALIGCSGAMAAEPCADLASRIVPTPEPVRKSPATPQVLALFDAANRGDEAAFGQLLATIPNVGDYAVDGDRLLHRLLRPAQGLVDDEAAWRKEHRGANDEHWAERQRQHAALFAAKARMLALAVKAGASVHDGNEDGAAPLHLAALYGSAEMVRMLLAAGADAGQQGRSPSAHEPLEFALRQEGAGQMEGIVTPAERTRVVLALLDAGAPLPRQRMTDLAACRRAARKEKSLELDRPFADYQLWGDLLALTTGREVLDRMVKLGTRPYTDEGGWEPFAFAAKAGNAEGVAWLKDNVARYDKDGGDRWADGAMWAMMAPRDLSGPVLDALLVPDVRWQQQVPREISYGGSASRHVPHTGRKTSLLASAILKGRDDVVRRLVAFGAPVTDSHGELLGKAVLNGHVAMVGTLLDLGVSPLAGEEVPALEMAVVPEDHHWIEPNDRLTAPLPALEQRREILALLLAALRARQVAVPADSRLLDWALRLAGTPEGAPLAGMVLDAGIPAGRLSFERVHDALASPDHSLFGKLLANGLMEHVDAAQRGDFASALLREAALANRADVLPALLALRPNLGQRGKDGLAVMDIAIREGNTALVEGLLAAGAKLDAPGSHSASGGTALDHAVVSGDAGMLRLIAAKTGRSTRATCVPDSAALARMVHAAGDAYWRTLREAGFGARRCPGMVPRLVAQFAGDSPTWYAGWVAERVRQRMADLYADDPRVAGDAATATLLREPRNSALAQVLQRAGWPAAALARPAAKPLGKGRIAADQTLRETLPGDYELLDPGPAASLQLRADGTFTLAYGSFGDRVDGVWTVENGRLRVANTPPPAGTVPYKPITPPAREGAAPAGALAVDVYFLGRKMPGMEISAFGDKPRHVSGTSQRDGWLGKWQGPVRQIALAHKSIDGGRPYVFEVPAAQAAQTRFAFAVSNKLPDRIFDEPVDIDGDTLVWLRGESRFSYRRKAAEKEMH